MGLMLALLSASSGAGRELLPVLPGICYQARCSERSFKEGRMDACAPEIEREMKRLDDSLGEKDRRRHSASIRKFNLLDAMILVAATAAGLGLLRMFLAGGRFFLGSPFQGRFSYYVQSGIEASYPFLMMWTFALFVLGLRQPRPPVRRLVRQPGMAACAAASLILVVQLLGIVPSDLRWALSNMMAQPSKPISTTGVKNPIGFNSPPARANAIYGAPTPPNSAAPAGAGAPLTQQAQPPGIFPSIPGLNMQPGEFSPTQFFIDAVQLHVSEHMIQRGYVAAGVAGAWFLLVLAAWWRPEPNWIDRLGRVLGFLWIVPYLIFHADLSRLWP